MSRSNQLVYAMPPAVDAAQGQAGGGAAPSDGAPGFQRDFTASG